MYNKIKEECIKDYAVELMHLLQANKLDKVFLSIDENPVTIIGKEGTVYIREYRGASDKVVKSIDEIIGILNQANKGDGCNHTYYWSNTKYKAEYYRDYILKMLSNYTEEHKEELKKNDSTVMLYFKNTYQKDDSISNSFNSIFFGNYDMFVSHYIHNIYEWSNYVKTQDSIEVPDLYNINLNSLNPYMEESTLAYQPVFKQISCDTLERLQFVIQEYNRLGGLKYGLSSAIDAFDTSESYSVIDGPNLDGCTDIDYYMEAQRDIAAGCYDRVVPKKSKRINTAMSKILSEFNNTYVIPTVEAIMNCEDLPLLDGDKKEIESLFNIIACRLFTEALDFCCPNLVYDRVNQVKYNELLEDYKYRNEDEDLKSCSMTSEELIAIQHVKF